MDKIFLILTWEEFKENISHFLIFVTMVWLFVGCVNAIKFILETEHYSLGLSAIFLEISLYCIGMWLHKELD